APADARRGKDGSRDDQADEHEHPDLPGRDHEADRDERADDLEHERPREPIADQHGQLAPSAMTPAAASRSISAGASPASFNTSAVCSPRSGAGRNAA